MRKNAAIPVVSSQRCVRAIGKHNDLENVGYTARHHTFFEMLGNFSFGDYFKKEAIEFAWNFLTKEIGLPKEKLLVTVYSEDDEAGHLGKPLVFQKKRLFALVRQITSGLWAIPVHVVLVLKSLITVRTFGGPPGTPEEDGDRFIEIWNLVFMQFNKQATVPWSHSLSLQSIPVWA